MWRHFFWHLNLKYLLSVFKKNTINLKRPSKLKIFFYMKCPTFLKFKSLFKNETKIVTRQFFYVVVRISKDKRIEIILRGKELKWVLQYFNIFKITKIRNDSLYFMSFQWLITWNVRLYFLVKPKAVDPSSKTCSGARHVIWGHGGDWEVGQAWRRHAH